MKQYNLRLSDKRWLEEQHHTLNRTLSDMAKELGCSRFTLTDRFRKFNIEIKRFTHISPETAKQMNDADLLRKMHYEQDMSMQEIASHYGVKAHCIAKRFEKFGIPKRQSPGVNIQIILNKNPQFVTQLDKEHNQEKLSLTQLAEKYNANIATVSLWFKKYKIPVNHEIFYSSGEKELLLFIQNNTNSTIIANGREIIPPNELDIYIPDKKLAIEFDGVYWHSSRSKDKTYHAEKTNACEKLGIQLLHIYDTEWKENSDIWKSIIANKLGLSKKIYARQCKIREISTTVTKDFLNKNHLQGNTISDTNVGLFLGDVLVGLMTFGRPRFDTSAEKELIRFAVVQGHRIVGGASKLFNYFIKTYQPKSIVSYADKRYSNGNLYQALGFTLRHTTQPTYCYLINGKLESRQKWQKAKLPKKLKIFDPKKTEEQNMLDNGYYRIYNCGQMVFVWTK